MPELPEVETVRRGLSRLIVGKTIVKATSNSPRSFPNSLGDVAEFVCGSTVVSVKRRAKVLLLELSSEYTLVIHLKMTGQLVYRGKTSFGAGHPNDSLINELPDRSTRVVFELSGGEHLYFNDQRKFGWVKLFPTIEVPNIDFMKRLGPEPLEDEFTGEIFVSRVRRRNGTSIKGAILDQTVLAGVGNIYADESLWGAMIHPASRVRDLSDEQLKNLLSEIKQVMNLSIEKGGSTDRNYVDAEGKRGSYLEFARVFRRQKLPCPRCGNEIIKNRVAGRGTHTCPDCQKEPV